MPDARAAFAVLGASGVTGRAVLAYLKRHLTTPTRWIIAGRNLQSLRALAAEFDPPFAPEAIEIGDLGQCDISKLSSRVRWLANLAGPYATSGHRVIESCLRTGTHYLDIAGEVDVIAEWIGRFHDRARALELKIIPAAGFESLPFDLLVREVVEKLLERGPSNNIHVDVLVSYFGVDWKDVNRFTSSGTTATALATLRRNPSKSLLLDPLSLSRGVAGAAASIKASPPLTASFDANYGVWRAALLPGPFINPAVIHRSNALVSESGSGYGDGFSYAESMNVSSIAPWPVGQSVVAHTLAAGAKEFLAALGESSLRRDAVLNFWEGLSRRPSLLAESQFDALDYQLDVLASELGGSTVRARLSGAGHPGYRSTGNIVGELLLGFAEKPGEVACGGVLTPAVALGKGALPLLKRAGLSYQWL